MKHSVNPSHRLEDLMISPDTFRKISFAVIPVFFVAAFLLLSHNAAAVNRTWDGGGATNNWSDAANWSGDTLPGSGEVAIFDGTSTKVFSCDRNKAIGPCASSESRLLRYHVGARI